MLRSTVIPLYLSLVTESGLNEVWISVWLFLHQLHTEGSLLRDPIAGSNLQRGKIQCWQVFTKYTFNYHMLNLYIFMGYFFLMRVGKKKTIQMIIIVSHKSNGFLIGLHDDRFH